MHKLYNIVIGITTPHDLAYLQVVNVNVMLNEDETQFMYTK